MRLPSRSALRSAMSKTSAAFAASPPSRMSSNAQRMAVSGALSSWVR
jgi:hypothetical protein